MNQSLPVTDPAPTPGDRIGHLAVRFPACLPVLHRHHLDYCCGGNVPLADACLKAGIDADALLGEIRAAIQEQPDADSWLTKPIPELIAFILARYHEIHRQQVPTLVEMARKVEQVHAEKPDVPRGLADFFETWSGDLESHMQKEEQILFPMILEGRGAQAVGPINVMEQEHQDHGNNLRRLKEIAHDLVPPAYACTTWRALYAGIAAFEEDLMAHINLENHVLFPRVLANPSEL